MAAVPALKDRFIWFNEESAENDTESQTTVLVTGFGPFGVHKENPSWLAVQELKRLGLGDDINLVVEHLPVEYEMVKLKVPSLWKRHKPNLVVHCGVSGVAQVLTLEQEAHNFGYKSTDIQGKIPPDNCCVRGGPDTLKSGIHMGKVCEAINSADCGVAAAVSHDPGRYLCDFTYFSSLNIKRTNVAFIHVPPQDQPYSVAQLAKGLKMAIFAMIEQLTSRNHEENSVIIPDISVRC